MKKLLCLFSAAMLVFASCSNDDKDSSDPKPSAPAVLVKKITEFEQGIPVSRNYIYNGNKIVSITDADGAQTKFTYTGDFVTKIENIDGKGVLDGTKELGYTNGKLTSFIEKLDGDPYNHKTKYVYNVDGTVSCENFKIKVSNGEEEKILKTRKLTFKDGNLIKDETSTYSSFYGTDYITTFEYEYDTKNSPSKNVTGHNLLLDVESSVNNVLKVTQTDTVGTNVDTYVTTHAYKYDVNNYPTEKVVTFLNGNSTSTSTETTQYAY